MFFGCCHKVPVIDHTGTGVPAFMFNLVLYSNKREEKLRQLQF
jgi:hypothetical protein